MIRFNRVTKRFGRQAAVAGLTVEIRANEVTALLGPNGSGKTTTLKMAAGLIKPDAGEVTIGDPPMSPTNPSARACLAYLPQRVTFPEALTGSEVVEFYRRLRGAAPDSGPAALRFASLNGASARAVATYSGGMAQRLGLAVAMLPGGTAVLLDEPTAALDPEGLAAFYALVDARRHSAQMVLFTSHQVADVERLADRVLVLVAGELVADVTRDDLRQWLDDRGVMRVRVRDTASALAAGRRVVGDAAIEGDELVVRGPAARRAGVLEAIRTEGVSVEGLVAESGRLEALYAELVERARSSGVDRS